MLFGNLQTAIIGVADLEVVWIEMGADTLLWWKIGWTFWLCT